MIHQGWKKWFDLDIPAERITCSGCSGAGSHLDSACPVRPCAQKNKLENCSFCPCFESCDILPLRADLVDTIKHKTPKKISQEEYDLFFSPYEGRDHLRKEKGKKKKELWRNTKMNEEECCPRFDPAVWDEKLVEWNNKKFITKNVSTFLHIPLNFGSVMKKLDKQVRDAQATMPGSVCLSDHTSKWNMTVYLAVDQEIPGAQNITLSGKFLSKVYEGPFQQTGNWCRDFEQFAQKKHLTISKWYMWYTTCPKCAKKYGKNYVVIVGQVV